MSEDGAIKVVLMAHHVVLRKGLRVMLERQDGLEIVAEASTLAEAVALDADVIVADLLLPEGRGLEVVGPLHERFPPFARSRATARRSCRRRASAPEPTW